MVQLRLAVTLWNRFILQKLTVALLVKKVSTLYGTRMFITIFTRIRARLSPVLSQMYPLTPPIPSFFTPTSAFPCYGRRCTSIGILGQVMVSETVVCEPPPQRAVMCSLIKVFSENIITIGESFRVFIDFVNCTACRDPQQCAELNLL
jgi:hypothetical protein